MNLNDELNKLLNILNIYDSSIKDIKDDLIKTLKILENCTSCKSNTGKYLDGIHKSINEIEKHLRWGIDYKLFKLNIRLNKEILCEGCKEKEIEKLTDKCGNEKIARFLYECKLNAKYSYCYIRWIPFDEFKNIKYLAKCGFGEVHKATWINYYDYIYKDIEVVLKRIYNNSSDDKIVDILNEVK